MSSDYENERCSEPEGVLNKAEVQYDSKTKPAGDPEQTTPGSGVNKPYINVTTRTQTQMFHGASPLLWQWYLKNACTDFHTMFV